MSRKNLLASRIDAFVYVALLIPVVLLVSFAPAAAQTSHDPSDWYGAQVIIHNSLVSGGWEHDAASLAYGGEGYNSVGSANLETGEVKAIASTGPRGPNNCHPWFCSYRAESVASAWDIITLTNNTDDIQYIPFEFSAEGAVSNGDWGWATGFARYYFGSDVYSWFGAPTIDITRSPFSKSETLRINPGQTLTRYWFVAIGANAANGGTADFGHTMRFTWDVPEGVTFGSASGSFMAAVGAVPEPSTWAMMILGFGLAGAAARKQRQPARVLA